MATIQQNIESINITKQKIRQAIQGQDVDMTNVPFTNYGLKIAEISGTPPITGAIPESLVFNMDAEIGDPYYSYNILTPNTLAGVLTTGAGLASCVSSDGNWAAFGYNTSPYIYFFKRTGEYTWTKLSNPSSLPSAGVYSIRMSKDGVYCCAYVNTKPLYIYKRTGDAYNLLTT